jgi:hypothetical protein
MNDNETRYICPDCRCEQDQGFECEYCGYMCLDELNEEE